jgi:hypothetical protein
MTAHDFVDNMNRLLVCQADPWQNRDDNDATIVLWVKLLNQEATEWERK